MFSYDLGDGAELRILEARHAEPFLAFIDSNRTHLRRYIPFARTIETVEEARTFIRRGLTRFTEDGLPWVGIWQEGEIVGMMLFFPLDHHIRATEIGYCLAERATGKGLMTRAAHAMLDYVFNELSLNRVSLQTVVNNQPSRAVAERLGFTFEGVRRATALDDDGGFVDMASYAMLASEWRARTAR